jgi:hypothetical protein
MILRYVAYGAILVTVICELAAGLLVGGAVSPVQLWTYLLGSLLVAVILMIVLEVIASNARKRNTIELVNSFLSNERRTGDRDTIVRTLPWPRVIQQGSPNFDDEANELLKAVHRELHFLELVGYAVTNRVVDEQVVRQTFRDVAIRDARQFAPFIAHWQKARPSLWRHVVELNERWTN